MTQPAAQAVAVDELCYAYRGGPDVLNIRRLEIATGERVFLHGPSGSGKTTLLGIVAGVLPPRTGRVHVLNEDIGKLRPASRDRFRGCHVGYLFQLFNLIPWLSVLDNIALPCRLHPTRRARLGNVSPKDAAARLADQLEIGGLLQRRVTELSVGQQQRVAAARALIGDPELVIADEPTSALDAHLRDRFIELLFAQCTAARATLLFVSHDLALGAHFDRVLSLSELNTAAA